MRAASGNFRVRKPRRPKSPFAVGVREIQQRTLDRLFNIETEIFADLSGAVGVDLLAVDYPIHGPDVPSQLYRQQIDAARYRGRASNQVSSFLVPLHRVSRQRRQVPQRAYIYTLALTAVAHCAMQRYAASGKNLR